MEFSSHNNHQPFLPEQKDPLFFDGVPPETQIVFWLSFNLFVSFLLLLDLFYFMRTKTVTNMKTAIKFTILWIFLALIFNAAIYHYKGRKMAMVWLTSYLLEKFLSVDNLFVIVTIFSSFRTPANFQQKVLTWGIFGAIIFRALFIVTGVLIIKQFHFLLTIFALFLVYTGFKLLFRGKEEDEEKEEAGFQEVVDSSLPSEKSSQTDLEDGGKNGKVFLSKKSSPHLENNLIIRVMKRFIPITNEYDEKGRFFVQCSEDLQTINESDISASSSSSSPSLPLYSSSSSSSYSSSPKFGRGGSTPKYKYAATPLLILLIVIETTDLIFALDSIPAILSITTDSFIVYTSNIFAILGLRALYFCLAALIKLFTYLEYALAVILIFIGAKMLLVFFGIHIPTEAALLFVILCLAVSIGFSLVFVKKAPVVRRHRIRSFIV